jgi:diaminopimelate decarboxylase
MYACKANTNLNILQLLRGAGAGLDAVSLHEVQAGLRAGFAPYDILFTPNSVGFDEIEEAVALGVRINIDNISVLEQFGNRYGHSVPLCIRINPHIVGGGNKNIQTGHIDSKFGISIHQLRHILRVVRAHNLQVDGLHMHTGSDILDSGVFIAAAEVLFNAALEFEHLQYLDFGSGFKVAYREGDVVTDIEDLGRKLTERFGAFCQEYGRPLELWFEPGKFLVSEAGFLLVKANVVKQTVSTVFVGVNSGMNHLMRPMLYDAYHRIENISNPSGTPRVYSVVGYICETDTLGWDRKLNEVREGDVLAIYNAGAYGITMASNYNLRARPAEVLIWQGKAHLIRQRESLDDILRSQVLLPQDLLVSQVTTAV